MEGSGWEGRIKFGRKDQVRREGLGWEDRIRMRVIEQVGRKDQVWRDGSGWEGRISLVERIRLGVK